MSEEDISKDSAKEPVKANRFIIAVSKNLMEVKMYPFSDSNEGGLSSFEDVMYACEQEKITAKINEELVKKQFLEVSPVEVKIAEGKKPKEGKDGYIEFKVDMSAKPQFIADPKGNDSIDYKNSMQVTLVNVGDVLADIIPPTNGEPGEDVLGAPIEPIPGNKARYFLGEGLEEKDNKIFVTIPGTPSVQEDVIMIRRNYVLQSDVDLSTGNINFPGTVVVHGNVTDGFEVISEENVVVNGIISGAKIKAKGYVKCSGGIQGKNLAEITAGSFVSATFVSACNIVAEGDVVITKDILHSNISCLGEIRTGGSIIGGVSTAFKGVECGGSFGSEAGVKTIVNIRTHYRQEKAKELANSVLPEVNSIFDRYKMWLKLETMSEEEGNLLRQEIENLKMLIQKRQTFDSRAAKFDALIYENKTARAKLLGMLEIDAIVASPYSKYICTSPIKGPLIVSENNSSARMAVMKGNTVIKEGE